MKDALWAVAALLAMVFGICAGTCLAGCKGRIDVKKAAVDVVQHQSVLDKCKAEARDAGSYPAFESCLKDAGVQ